MFLSVCTAVSRYVSMVKQKTKTKLWGKIEEIKRYTTTEIFDKKYQSKLLGLDKLLWVIAKDLSVERSC